MKSLVVYSSRTGNTRKTANVETGSFRLKPSTFSSSSRLTNSSSVLQTLRVSCVY
jgi:menaquinone-dependent protoporphyrinogen IX oxidase